MEIWRRLEDFFYVIFVLLLLEERDVGSKDCDVVLDCRDFIGGDYYINVEN